MSKCDVCNKELGQYANEKTNGLVLCDGCCYNPENERLINTLCENKQLAKDKAELLEKLAQRLEEPCKDVTEQVRQLREALAQLKIDSDKIITNLCNTGNDEAWSIIKLNNMITDIDDALAPQCMTCDGEKEVTDTEDNVWLCPECVSPKILEATK